MRKVFTDGSASPNPGPGGFAVIDSISKKPLILGRGKNTTNIKMEGEAILAAMKNIPEVEIYTDSEFWINVLTKWAKKWEENSWKKANGPIKNLELVKELFNKFQETGAKLAWTRGHVGTELNELADEWANKAREGISFADLEIIEVEER